MVSAKNRAAIRGMWWLPAERRAYIWGLRRWRVIHSMYFAGMHLVRAVVRRQNSMFIGCYVEASLEWFLGCLVDIA